MKVLIATILLLSSTFLAAQNWSPVSDKIKTKWTDDVSPEKVWSEYPRPQMERADWINLNGLWEYALLKKNQQKPKKYQGQILVPFCIESSLSGVGKEMMPDNRLWYKREFEIPENWNSKSIIINFEAVDNSTTIWINGALVGNHKGGFDRFSFDISQYIKPIGKQELIVSVDDPTSSQTQPRGKQRIQPSGITYTPVSGIWQTVWLEAVSKELYIKEIQIIPDIDNKSVTITPLLNKPLLYEKNVKIQIIENEKTIVNKSIIADKENVLELKNVKLWSPENPFLYNLKLTLLDENKNILDEVSSYFGMRKISLGDVKGNKFLFLNNKPLFHYGTLDQGWWPDGLYTPPTDEAMKYDIEITKKMGFNMIRKHVKVEPDRWYYHCDKLGILVWQDMPSGMASRLNAKGKLKGVPRLKREEPDGVRRSKNTAQFEWELWRMIDMHRNSPSIVVWVPFNEGWGQFTTKRIAEAIQAYDPTRLVNAASGWSLRPCGDIYDIHTYDIELKVPSSSTERAVVIGEFGGIGYPVENHLWNPEMRNWGYQTYHSKEELLKSYKFKFDQIVKMKNTVGLSAAVYTQTTDVEGEVNGLMTYDRKVIKIPEDTLKNIHSVLYKMK